MARVLIVEDEGLLAFHLKSMVEDTTGAICTIVASVKRARTALEGEIDFAFLDINVLDGTTFDLGRELAGRAIAFAFTSSSNRCDVPGDLSWVPFLPKPFTAKTMASVLLSGLSATRHHQQDGGSTISG